MSDYRVIVAGGRDFRDENYLTASLDRLREEFPVTEIVSGHAGGADRLAEAYARQHNPALKIFPADRKKYSRAAGPVRNREMPDYILGSNPIVVAFRDGKSRGTKNMIDPAKKKNVDCRVLMYKKANDLCNGSFQAHRMI